MSFLGMQTHGLSPPTALDYEENRGPNLIAANLCGAILATIAVCLRLLARGVIGPGFGVDDLLLVLALILGWGLAVTTIEMVKHGMGKHMNVLSADEVVACSKAFYAFEMEWTFAILFVKTSILIFYNRLFGQLRYFHWTSIAVGLFSIAWATTTLFLVIFQCVPVRHLWYPDSKGRCIHAWAAWVAISVVDVVVDLIIFFLPVHAAWKLHVSTKQRVLLVLTFAIGSTAWIFGGVRLAAVCIIFVHQYPDWTWYISPSVMWAALESTLGITAISIATTKPLQKFVLEKYRFMRNGRIAKAAGPIGADPANAERTGAVVSDNDPTTHDEPSHSLTASSETRTDSEIELEKPDIRESLPEEFPQYLRSSSLLPRSWYRPSSE